MTVFQGNNLSICLIQLWYIIFSIYLVTISAELQRFRHQAKRDGSLSFLVVGDWGRQGTYNQTDVAFQMGRYGEKLDIDFVLSTGDNFYNNGLIAVSDPAFKTSFTDIYTAKSLQRPWYTVLGNHDYRGNVKAQLSPALRKIDSRWLCLRSYIINAEFAEFFLLDTTPFVDVYFDDPLDHAYDWRGVSPRETYLADLLKDLEQELRDSTAEWKIVVGHHAIRSIGHHGDTPELVDRLLPILKAHNVDMYVNGHDHCLEHITCIDNYDSPIHFLTSGGGSKAWRADVKDHNQCAVNFFYDGQGFMSMQLTKNDAEITFYDINGRVLHQFNRSKQPVSAM